MTSLKQKKCTKSFFRIQILHLAQTLNEYEVMYFLKHDLHLERYLLDYNVCGVFPTLLKFANTWSGSLFTKW